MESNRKSKRKPSTRELSSKKVFGQSLENKLRLYRTTVIEKVDEYKEKDSDIDKLSEKKSASASRKIMDKLNAVSLMQDKKSKLLEYERAAQLMSYAGFSKDKRKVANLLVKIYQDLLEKCSHMDAISFSRTCMHGISYYMSQGKLAAFDELLRAPSLQAMLIKSFKKTPKEVFDKREEEDEARSTHDVISKAGLYCIENDTFYKSPASEIAKFGFLTFATLAEIEEYQAVLKAIDKKYEYKPASKELGALLRKGSFLRRREDESEDDSSIADDNNTPRTTANNNSSSSSEGVGSRSIS